MKSLGSAAIGIGLSLVSSKLFNKKDKQEAAPDDFEKPTPSGFRGETIEGVRDKFGISQGRGEAGLAGASRSSPDSIATMTQSGGMTTISVTSNITVPTQGQQAGNDPARDQKIAKEVQNQVKSAAVSVITDMMRPGGMLAGRK